MYRGVSLTVAGSFPYEGIKFGVYDSFKRWGAMQSASRHGDDALKNSVNPGSSLARSCYGASAAMIAHVATYPNDTIRRRMQMQGSGNETAVYTSALDCVRQILRNEGWEALYRGMGLTIVRSVPNTGVQFALYELCKDIINKRT